MNKPSASKWIRNFLCFLLAILLLLSAVVYIVDPFMQFRTRDNAYFLQEWYVSGGLIKNYEYDTLILGSSVTQNFDMNVFRQELGVKPLHIGLGGLTTVELAELLRLAYETQKADTYYIGVDLPVLNGDNPESRMPEHLIKNDLQSKLRYLLSYEVWFRYLPVDIGFMILDKLGVNLPEKFIYQKSIDRLGDWRLDFPEWGEDYVLYHHKYGLFSVSHVETEGLYEGAVACIDTFFERCDFEKGEHIFFFPPYSSVCWVEYQMRGQFDIYMQIKQYFIEKALEHGVKVYDFQAADFTMELEHYRDTIHYMPPINDWMVECFAGEDYVVTAENRRSFEEKLIENTNAFREKYPDLFH